MNYREHNKRLRLKPYKNVAAVTCVEMVLMLNLFTIAIGFGNGYNTESWIELLKVFLVTSGIILSIYCLFRVFYRTRYVFTEDRMIKYHGNDVCFEVKYSDIQELYYCRIPMWTWFYAIHSFFLIDPLKSKFFVVCKKVDKLVDAEKYNIIEYNELKVISEDFTMKEVKRVAKIIGKPVKSDLAFFEEIL